MRQTAVFKIMLFALFILHSTAIGAKFYRYADIQKNGKAYRFHVRSYDPYDPFRGRYLAIDVGRAIKVPPGFTWEWGKKVYVLVTKDDEGFAKLGPVLSHKPMEGDYVISEIARYNSTKNMVWIENPFDRFYINETIAPVAEKIFIQASAAEKNRIWIVVKVKDGRAVIDDLYVDGRPIVQVAREMIPGKK